jgi:hypothetical protein
MLVLRFSLRFLLTTSLRRRRISLYFSLFTVAIPAKYTSKFWELFEAPAYTNYVSTCAGIYVCTYRCVFVRIGMYLYVSVYICMQAFVL